MSLKSMLALSQLNEADIESLLGAADGKWYRQFIEQVIKLAKLHNVDYMESIGIVRELKPDLYKRYERLSRNLNLGSRALKHSRKYNQYINNTPTKPVHQAQGREQLDEFEQLVQKEVELTGANWHKAIAQLHKKINDVGSSPAEKAEFQRKWQSHSKAVKAHYQAEQMKFSALAQRPTDIVRETDALIEFNMKTTGDSRKEVLAGFKVQEPLRFAQYQEALKRQLGLG
jgi:hypothetical protein